MACHPVQFSISKWKACEVVNLPRSTERYKHKRDRRSMCLTIYYVIFSATGGTRDDTPE